MARCFSVLLIAALMLVALPSFSMSCAPDDRDCPKRQDRLTKVLLVTWLNALKTHCSSVYPKNVAVYDEKFKQFLQILKDKSSDVAEIQEMPEYSSYLTNAEKEVAILPKDKLQSECNSLLTGPGNW